MDDLNGARYCGVGIRGVAMAIDSFAWFVLFLVSGLLVGVPSGQTEVTASGVDTDLEGTLAAVSLVLWLGLAVGYHALLEWRYGKTIGKYLVGIRVVAADGAAPSLRASVVRNVLRLVDWLPGFYLVGIAALLASERKRRLGDRVAETAVVRL